MVPLIASGQRVELDPVRADDPLDVRDIVLVQVRERIYLHLIKAVEGNRYLIGNNRGGINGWVGRSAIYGRMRMRS